MTRKLSILSRAFNINNTSNNQEKYQPSTPSYNIYAFLVAIHASDNLHGSYITFLFLQLHFSLVLGMNASGGKLLYIGLMRIYG